MYRLLLFLCFSVIWLGYCFANEAASLTAENPTKTVNASLAYTSDFSENDSDCWNNTPEDYIVRCARYCKPVAFEHDYLLKEGITVSYLNKWLSTEIDEYGTLNDTCLQSNGLLVLRKCLKNTVTGIAEWQNITDWDRIVCLNTNNTEAAIIAKQLLESSSIETEYEPSQRFLFEVPVTSIIGMSRRILGNSTQILPYQVYLAACDLKKKLLAEDVSPSLELTSGVIDIFNKLVRLPRNVLRLSTYNNATNTFLSTFEEYLDKLSGVTLLDSQQCISHNNTVVEQQQNHLEQVDLKGIGVFGYLTTNVSVYFVDPSCANITGIAIYNGPSVGRRSTQHGFWYRFLLANETIEAVMTQDMVLASFMHETLWESILLRRRRNRKRKSLVLVFKVYANDKLFVEPGSILRRKPVSKILSISIPGFSSQLPEGWLFLFRRPNDTPPPITQDFGCGYWNYGTWLSSGVHTKFAQEGFAICSTTHLTQFSMLLDGVYEQGDLSNEVLIHPLHSRILDRVTLCGCSLSLLGLLGIWLTAALFSSWRRLTSTKILLNLCFVLSIEMFLFLFVNTEHISEALVFRGKDGVCILIGAALQYAILVHFCWMFIIALLQFQRYVTIVGVQRPKRYILKAAATAWSLPLIPTLLACWFQPGDYVPSKEQLLKNMRVCYPSGHALTFGVIVPVVLVISANIIIFINVFLNISVTLAQSNHQLEKSLLMQQIRLAVLLFFLLGMTWIFGLFAYIRAGLIFSYLFCITATLQGFVFFVFFVLIDAKARNAWLSLLHCSQNVDKSQKSHELEAVETVSSRISNKSNR